MTEAFGSRAEPFAAGLPDLEAIVCEPETLQQAYVAAVARRASGDPFYAMVLYDDPRCAVATAVAGQLLTFSGQYDARLVSFMALAAGELIVNDKLVREIWDQPVSPLAHAFCALAEAVLVRSFAEQARLAPHCPGSRPLLRVISDRPFPEVGERKITPSVVVWAPQRSGRESALEAFALAEFWGPVTVVCSDGELATIPTATFVTPQSSAAGVALGAAAVVVCSDHGDPSDAIAFARAGFTVVAPVTSGAGEYVADLATYDGANVRSLWDAVAIAFGRPTGRVLPLPRLPRAPAIPELPMLPEGPPLVSFVIEACDQREDMARTLDSLASQRYANLEVVVVNGKQAPVGDLVAQYPFARAVDAMPGRGGLDAARGAYVQFLAAGDQLYPDHVQRLLAAMLRGGAEMACGTTLLRRQERRADATWITVAFDSLAGQTMLARREVFERGDPSASSAPIWVDQVTCERSVQGR